MNFAAIHAIILGAKPGARVCALSVKIFGDVDARHDYITMEEDEVAKAASASIAGGDFKLMIDSHVQFYEKVLDYTGVSHETSLDSAVRKLRDLLLKYNVAACIWADNIYTLIDHRTYVYCALEDTVLIRFPGSTLSNLAVGAIKGVVEKKRVEEPGTSMSPDTSLHYIEERFRRARSLFGHDLAPPKASKVKVLVEGQEEEDETPSLPKAPPLPPALPKVPSLPTAAMPSLPTARPTLPGLPPKQ